MTLPEYMFGEDGVVLDVRGKLNPIRSRYIVVMGTTFEGNSLPIVLTPNELRRYGIVAKYHQRNINIINRGCTNRYCCVIQVMGVVVFLDIPSSIFKRRISLRIHDLRERFEYSNVEFKLYTRMCTKILFSGHVTKNKNVDGVEHSLFCKCDLRKTEDRIYWVQPNVGMCVEKLVLINNISSIADIVKSLC